MVKGILPLRLAWLLCLLPGPSAALWLPGCGAWAAAAPGTQSRQEVEARIRRVESGLPSASPGAPAADIMGRMAHYQVPGLSLAVIHGGRIDWAKGYGVVESGQANPVTPQTLFQAASLSEPVSAMGALRLVQEGLLDLDEDVNARFILWQVPESDFARAEKVTLRRILSHCAGLTVPGFRGYPEGAPLPTLVQVLNGEPPANTPPIRVDLEPASPRRYSDGGFCVMQQLICEVTMKNFPGFMRDTVLLRLEMNNSTYEQPLPATLRGGAASGHRSDGTVVPGRFHTYPEMAALGLWTTPSDLARFAIELQEARAGRSRKVISSEQAGEMLTFQCGRSGLGIEIAGDNPGVRFQRGGSSAGYSCQMAATMETGQGVVVMTNSDNGAALAWELIHSVALEYQWPGAAPAAP